VLFYILQRYKKISENASFFAEKFIIFGGVHSNIFWSALQNYFERTPENVPRLGTNNTRHLLGNKRPFSLTQTSSMSRADSPYMGIGSISVPHGTYLH
jgi:hypothetical protein